VLAFFSNFPRLWMAHHLLRVNGFPPAWIDQRNWPRS